MKEEKNKFTFEEKEIADKVADEILTVKDDEENRKYFFLLAFFLICLIFLVSSLSFAVFDTYYNGGKKNVIDVGIDVIIDDDKDEDDNETNNNSVDKNGNSSNQNGSTGNDDSKNNSGDNNKPNKPEAPINPDDNTPGSVLFSFNEGSNYIDMVDVYPMNDNLGKKLTGDKQYFDFNVSATLKNNKGGTLVYEIALVPVGENTIKEENVRVYLTEDERAVSVLKNKVNNFSDLPDSDYYDGAKVIYRKVVTENYNGNYIFRMWLSSKAKVANVPERFGCKIAVNAYYR